MDRFSQAPALVIGRFSRRAMLIGTLASVPAVAIVASSGTSNPAIPMPDRHELLRAYSEWLFYERLLLMRDLHPGISTEGMYRETAFVPANTLASDYHGMLMRHQSGQPWEELPSPATRALTVLQAVGMDFRPLGDRS